MAVTGTGPASILVLRALGLGDLLTGVPALRALRRAHPDHRIVLAAPAVLAELLPAIGAVDELLAVDGLTELPWAGLGPRLAVNLHGKGPQSTGLLCALRPGALWAHAHPDHPDLPGPPWRDDLHEVDRWCRLLAHHGVPADRTDLTLRRLAVPSPAPGAAVVHPGAGFAARRWPAARYAQVASWLAGMGHQVVITGNRAERTLAVEVAGRAGLPAGSVLAGRTTLATLSSVVAGAVVVICGDTGIAHLATAYGTPSVVLFGPVPPRLWGPPPWRAQHTALWAGRTGDTFASRPHGGLLRLTVASVIEAAERMLRGGGACPATSASSVPDTSA